MIAELSQGLKVSDGDWGAGVHYLMVRGLPARLAAPLRELEVAESFSLPGLSATERRRPVANLAKTLGVKLSAEARWPTAAESAALGRRLGAAGVRLVWRGDAEYPARLREGLGPKAPPWLLIKGDAARFELPLCAMVGSRETDRFLRDAARNLAGALSATGIGVVSGMAVGADAASHEGALAAAGRAGTIGLPARGLLALTESEGRLAADPGMTLIGMGRPDEDFSAALALRRNDAIAALGGATVLVASGLKGGAIYAVRWAIEAGRPLFAFEAGRRTPAGNASLIRNGLAHPLPLSAPPETLAAEIRTAMERFKPRPSTQQLDWVG